jgi:hypothetical protein
MQKLATKVFIIASVVFGIVGIGMVITAPFGEDQTSSDFNQLLQKLLLICVFVILPSFALSVAGKYLNNKR